MTNIENTNEVKTIFPIRYFYSKDKLFDKEECFSSQNDKIYRIIDIEKKNNLYIYTCIKLSSEFVAKSIGFTNDESISIENSSFNNIVLK